MIRRLLLLAFVVVGGIVVLAGPAAADNCSSPGDCEETGGYNGMIAVVGGAAAVAAAAAAAVANTPEGEETDLAIVQVSVDTIDLAIGEPPGELTLTGWHVGAEGKLEQVGMTLSIEVPPASGITVTPLTGTGTLVATVSIDEATLPDDTDEVEIVAHGAWDGKAAQQTVTIYIGDDLEMFLTEEGGDDEGDDADDDGIDPGGDIGEGGATGGGEAI